MKVTGRGGLVDAEDMAGNEENRDATKEREHLEPEQGDQVIGTVGKKTWIETAKAAGVVTMVQAGEQVINEKVSEKESSRKRTPKEYRTQQPKVKEVGKKLTMPEKKLFKEAFITDKDRLHKRQQKFNKDRNFIVIMEDNVLGKGAATSGKYMVFGSGALKERFLSEGIKFDQEKYYMHANHTDFQMEKVTNTQTEKRKIADGGNVSQEFGQTAAKVSRSKEAEHQESRVKKFKPIKVATPGTFLGQISDSSEDDAD